MVGSKERREARGKSENRGRREGRKGEEGYLENPESTQFNSNFPPKLISDKFMCYVFA